MSMINGKNAKCNSCPICMKNDTASFVHVLIAGLSLAKNLHTVSEVQNCLCCHSRIPITLTTFFKSKESHEMENWMYYQVEGKEWMVEA